MATAKATTKTTNAKEIKCEHMTAINNKARAKRYSNGLKAERMAKEKRNKRIRQNVVCVLVYIASVTMLAMKLGLIG